MKAGDKVLLKVPDDYTMRSGSWGYDVKTLDNTVVTVTRKRNDSWYDIKEINFHIPANWLHEIPQNQQGGTMRFKTEEEFVKEFVKDWENTVCHRWNREMDYLFGTPITKQEKKELQSSEKFYRDTMPEHKHYKEQWCISKDMVTEDTKTYISKTHILNRALFEDAIRIALNTKS